MASLRQLQAPLYRVVVRDCPHGEDALWVRVVKAWWGGPGRGGTHRELHAFCVPMPDGLEPERIARALEAAAAALRG